VADVAAADAAVARLLAAHGRLDILVNNAGIRNDMLMVWMTSEDWGKVLATNLTGFYNVARPVVKDMLLKRKGRIVAVASTSGQAGLPGQTNYAASKGGLIAACKALALETARRGVTVNVVAPGLVETEMIEGAPREEMVGRIPWGAPARRRRWRRPWPSCVRRRLRTSPGPCSTSTGASTCEGVRGGTGAGSVAVDGAEPGWLVRQLVLRHRDPAPRREGRVSAARAVAAYFVLAAPRARRASNEVLARVFGARSWWRRVSDAYRHFFSFGTMLVDRVAILCGREAAFSYDFAAECNVNEAFGRGKGLVVVGAHFGNWEAASQLMRRWQRPVHVVALDREVGPVRRVMAVTASQKAFHVIPADGQAEASLEIMAALRRGEVVALHGTGSWAARGPRRVSRSRSRLPGRGLPGGGHRGRAPGDRGGVRLPGMRYGFVCSPPEDLRPPRAASGRRSSMPAPGGTRPTWRRSCGSIPSSGITSSRSGTGRPRLRVGIEPQQPKGAEGREDRHRDAPSAPAAHADDRGRHVRGPDRATAEACLGPDHPAVTGASSSRQPSWNAWHRPRRPSWRRPPPVDRERRLECW